MEKSVYSVPLGKLTSNILAAPDEAETQLLSFRLSVSSLQYLAVL